MAGKRKGSSPCIEFFVSLCVGSVAIVGGLFILGFLLVEPVRHPPGQRTANIDNLIGRCKPKEKSVLLPRGCSHDNQESIVQSVCSNRECSCGPEQNGDVCCCRATKNEPLSDLICPAGVTPPLLVNATNCGCTVCDHLTVQVHVTVVTVDGNEPIVAAMVMKNDGREDSYNMLGLTNSMGRFMYTESVGRVTVELKVVAAGYMPYMTLPIRLQPHRHVIELRVTMIPSINMDVGLGGADIAVRLGPMVSVLAPAGSFYSGKDPYDNSVHFQGMFATPDDPNGLAGVPGSEFMVYNSATGSRDNMELYFATWLGFLGNDGEQLDNDQLQMQVSVATGGQEAPDLCLIVYNETAHEWQKHSDLVQSAITARTKRQGPVVLETANIPLSVFAAVAQQSQVNCWFQGRTFDESGLPLSGVFITLEEVVDRGGSSLLVRLATNTGSQTGRSIAPNALCLPVDCGPPITAFISSRVAFDTSSTALAPQQFPPETFDITENAPIRFGDFFSFEEVITSTADRPRPFYSTETDCVQAGVEVNPSSLSAFFGFEEAIAEVLPVPADSCFIKLQILDCFDDNEITVTSINPVTAFIDNSQSFIVTKPPEIEMPTDSSGTFPPEVTTMAGGGVCDESTATLRAACVPYICGDDILVLARPNPASGQSPETFCEITSRSVLLSNGLLSDTDTSDQLVVRPHLLSTNDFNSPNSGLYYEAANNLNAAVAAEQMCNAGLSDGEVATEIDVTTGAAVEISCYTSIFTSI